MPVLTMEAPLSPQVSIRYTSSRASLKSPVREVIDAQFIEAFLQRTTWDMRGPSIRPPKGRAPRRR